MIKTSSAVSVTPQMSGSPKSRLSGTEIAAAGDAEADGERLQEDRHQVGDHDDAEERVAEAGAAGEVSCPIARAHVADSDEVAGTGER